MYRIALPCPSVVPVRPSVRRLSVRCLRLYLRQCVRLCLCVTRLSRQNAIAAIAVALFAVILLLSPTLLDVA